MMSVYFHFLNMAAKALLTFYILETQSMVNCLGGDREGPA